MNELDSGTPTVWIPVVRSGGAADPRTRATRSHDGCEWLAPPRACFDVRPDGSLIIGIIDPEEDTLLSELLFVDGCGEA